MKIAKYYDKFKNSVIKSSSIKIKNKHKEIKEYYLDIFAVQHHLGNMVINVEIKEKLTNRHIFTKSIMEIDYFDYPIDRLIYKILDKCEEDSNVTAI